MGTDKHRTTDQPQPVAARPEHDVAPGALFHVTENATQRAVARIAVVWPSASGSVPRVHIEPNVDDGGLRFLYATAQDHDMSTAGIRARLEAVHAAAVLDAAAVMAAGWPDRGEPHGRGYFPTATDTSIYLTREDPTQIPYDVWVSRQPAVTAEDFLPVVDRYLRGGTGLSADDDAEPTPAAATAPTSALSSTTTAWISVVELAPGSDGIRGGPWLLTITRVSHQEGDHWWPWEQDEDGRALSVLRESDGSAVLVRLRSDLPFEEAADAFSLDPAVFGSPTLWPGAHLERNQRVQGWSWTHMDVSAEFPFVGPSAVADLP